MAQQIPAPSNWIPAPGRIHMPEGREDTCGSGDSHRRCLGVDVQPDLRQAKEGGPAEPRSPAQARLDALAAAVGIPSIYPAVPIRQQLAALLADCRRAFAASPAAVSPGLAALARVPLCGVLPGPPRPPASLALVQARARDACSMFCAARCCCCTYASFFFAKCTSNNAAKVTIAANNNDKARRAGW